MFWPGLSLTAQIPQPAGDIAPAIVVTVPSVSLGSEPAATILLPAGYAESRQRYPVLYLLHGGGLLAHRQPEDCRHSIIGPTNQ
jgi:enterochelin esterase-like enzyme